MEKELQHDIESAKTSQMRQISVKVTVITRNDSLDQLQHSKISTLEHDTENMFENYNDARYLQKEQQSGKDSEIGKDADVSAHRPGILKQPIKDSPSMTHDDLTSGWGYN